MSRVVPSKFMSKQNVLGVESIKEIRTEKVRLLPQQHASTSYTPTGVNRISWRIPAYSNAMLDTEKSFVSFKAKMSGTGTFDASNNGVFGNNLPIFNRMVIKSSSGLVLEDISNFNVLTKLISLLKTDEDYQIEKGIYGTTEGGSAVGALMNPTANGIVYTIQFDTGILSKHLNCYLPLFMMDGNGGMALEVELYLSPSSETIKQIGTTATNISYSLTDVVYNLHLLRLDETLCSKFNQIACDPNEQIKIPYTTYRCYTNTLQSTQNVLHISENATNLKRLWSTFLDQTQTQSGNVLPFRGSVKEANGQRIVKYNSRVGTTYTWNEPVQELINNNVTLNYVKDAVFAKDKPLMLAKTNSDYTATRFEDDEKFFIVSNFDYSKEAMNGAIQGISSINSIQLELSLDSTPSSPLVNHSFAEVGYELTVQNGQVRFVEPKPGSQSVY
ncbi:MAG: hypothetical protein ACYS26_19065 [Planctomycetota bacterium]|jgi:hypothetical protein